MRNTENTRLGACLSLDLLRHIRDTAPTENELREWLGRSEFGLYHILRKSGLLLVHEGRVVLSPQHLSDDGKRFYHRNRRYNLGEDTVDIFCGRSGPQDEG